MFATAINLDAARSAATTYSDSIAAERRLLAILPAPGHPDRATVEASLADVSRVARRAYGRYRRVILDLLTSGQVVQASRLVLDVRDRTRAGRTPVEITVTEDDQ
jgi:5-deoxy-D-glucuronate isomerase